MALLNDNGNYIKLSADDRLVIYKDEESRIREKEVPAEFVIRRLDELYWPLYYEMVDCAENLGIDPDDSDEEAYAQLQQDYPDFGEVCEKYWSWYAEYTTYMNDLQLGLGPIHDFPLLEKDIPNIKWSLPVVLFKGSSPAGTTSSEEEAYLIAKENGSFGETTDC